MKINDNLTAGFINNKEKYPFDFLDNAVYFK